MSEVLELTQILWDYLCLHQTPQKADCIVGFGCYNEDVARRAAQLWLEGFAPYILFTGALGRNTRFMWTDSEARRFARVALAEGVPEEAILLEERATNSGENLIYARKLLQERNIPARRIIGVQKPYMERRLYAAFPVYWPEAEVTVTSWQQTMTEYMQGVPRFGRTEEQTIHMIVGDFQRIGLYAQKGYQVPQEIPAQVQAAYEKLVEMGYTQQLAR